MADKVLDGMRVAILVADHFEQVMTEPTCNREIVSLFLTREKADGGWPRKGLGVKCFHVKHLVVLREGAVRRPGAPGKGRRP